MHRVLVRHNGRWYIGVYCTDDMDPGVWYLDGVRDWIGARAVTEWQELPQ